MYNAVKQDMMDPCSRFGYRLQKHYAKAQLTMASLKAASRSTNIIEAEVITKVIMVNTAYMLAKKATLFTVPSVYHFNQTSTEELTGH